MQELSLYWFPLKKQTSTCAHQKLAPSTHIFKQKSISLFSGSKYNKKSINKKFKKANFQKPLNISAVILSNTNKDLKKKN